MQHNTQWGLFTLKHAHPDAHIQAEGTREKGTFPRKTSLHPMCCPVFSFHLYPLSTQQLIHSSKEFISINDARIDVMNGLSSGTDNRHSSIKS
jgi:hypothetical protein